MPTTRLANSMAASSPNSAPNISHPSIRPATPGCPPGPDPDEPRARPGTCSTPPRPRPPRTPPLCQPLPGTCPTSTSPSQWESLEQPPGVVNGTSQVVQQQVQ